MHTNKEFHNSYYLTKKEGDGGNKSKNYCAPKGAAAFKRGVKNKGRKGKVQQIP